MNPILTSCSFCGSRHDPTEMVWAPNGKTICGFCVASFTSSLDHFGPRRDAAISEAELVDVDAMRRRWAAMSDKRAALLRTHFAYGRRDGVNIAAYLDKATERCIIITSTIPVFPEGLYDEDP